MRRIAHSKPCKSGQTEAQAQATQTLTRSGSDERTRSGNDQRTYITDVIVAVICGVGLTEFGLVLASALGLGFCENV
jgi:hypothetical protein